jgi:parvin
MFTNLLDSIFFINFLHALSVQEVQAEGKYAIDSPGNPNAIEIPPEDYNLVDNEQRSVIQQQSLNDPHVQELCRLLVEWINDELVDDRIIVSNIEEDLYDGQVLQKLWEKLTTHKLNVLEVTQSSEGQRQKLNVVLTQVNHVSLF